MPFYKTQAGINTFAQCINDINMLINVRKLDDANAAAYALYAEFLDGGAVQFPFTTINASNYAEWDAFIKGLPSIARTHREALKAAGYLWAPKKMRWYFRPEAHKSYKRAASWSMDKIYEAYGREAVNNQQRHLATGF